MRLLTILDDVRFTLRQLRRTPGFLLTTVLTLTLAITANVVVYGIANGLIFHRLAVPSADRLVQVQSSGFMGITFSYPNYRDLQERTQGTFSTLATARLTRFSIGVQGAAQPVWGFVVSGNYFQMLGVTAQLGRLLEPADDVSEDGSRVLVLSDRCWRVRFHADPAILGSVVALGKVPFTVIGVAPPGFRGTEKIFAPDAWAPFHDGLAVDGYTGLQRRAETNAFVYGRLRDGVTREQADADPRRVSAQMAREFPKENGGTVWRTAPVGLLGESLGGPVRGFITGVAALAVLVLLAACANLGVLFSSRTADRARELGVRLAIGSSRQRILRQLVIESLLLSLASGTVAMALAALLLHELSAWHLSSNLPLELVLNADWMVYLASAGLALATGLLFGLQPARQIWRTDPYQSMRAAGSTVGSDRSGFRSALLVLQLAMCCLLVTASLVAVRGLQRTFRMPLGFDPQGVTLATVDVSYAGYKGEAARAVQARLLTAVSSIPGVSAAAYSDNQPLSLNSNMQDTYAPGTANFDHEHLLAAAMVYSVSPGYFQTTRTTLVSGREFTEHDGPGAPRVAVVNEVLARRLFGSTDVIGKRFPTGEDQEVEVVGVAADGKYLSLTEEPSPALFEPMLQSPSSQQVLIVRSIRDPAEMTHAMREAVASVDSSIPIFSCTSWLDELTTATFPAKAATLALGVMGGLAAMLAVTGVFGVASHSVARQMRALGIRVALGAQVAEVLQAALGRTVILMAAGSAIGLGVGVACSRLLGRVVYHASANDPLVLLAAVGTMAGLGVLASAIPARRAVRVDPAALL